MTKQTHFIDSVRKQLLTARKAIVGFLATCRAQNPKTFYMQNESISLELYGGDKLIRNFWIPAFAGMTSKERGNDVMGWIHAHNDRFSTKTASHCSSNS